MEGRSSGSPEMTTSSPWEVGSVLHVSLGGSPGDVLNLCVWSVSPLLRLVGGRLSIEEALGFVCPSGTKSHQAQPETWARPSGVPFL